MTQAGAGGHRTAATYPKDSKMAMSPAEGSIILGPPPCRARPGWAWWRLRQLSPHESGAGARRPLDTPLERAPAGGLAVIGGTPLTGRGPVDGTVRFHEPRS